MLVIKLALRNLFRNRRRTILSLSLIALGTAALFLFRGFSEEITGGIRHNAINQAGHLSIVTEAFWEGVREGYDYLISPEVVAQVKGILAAEPQVISYSAQHLMDGLIGTEEKSSIFLAFGVEPANPRPEMEIKEGRPLKPGDMEAVLLTPEFADVLGVGVGDRLEVTARTVDGRFSTGHLEVVGLYRPRGIGGVGVIAPVSFIQMMRDTDRISGIAVKLADERVTEEVALRLQRVLDEKDLPGLKVRTWSEAMPFYHQLGLFMGTIFSFIGLVIFLLVFFSVLEGLTMAFFERIQEVGAVRAIGTRRHQIFGMFLSEGVLLGLFSGLVGVALGCGIGGLINIAGLTWTPPVGHGDLPFRIALGLHIASVPFLVALVATTISAIYPAYRAAKLEIASALRFV